ncbi:Tim44 domain-containing protein, partial [Orientia tsutsugamushi]
DYIITELIKLKSKVPSFNINRFYNTAINVIKMIIEAVQNADYKTIFSLLDKRFVDQFHQISSKYVNIHVNSINFKLSNLNSLGNNVFIKIRIEIDGNKLKEEWTFSKNITIPGPQWYLSNIEEVS